jgi:hypothetical protein
VAKILAPQAWLTVAQVRRALDGDVRRDEPQPVEPAEVVR